MTTVAARHVGFVRNVMIGREGLHRQVLLDLFSDAGGQAPRSYISTGNISFSAPESDLPLLIASVEEGIAAVIGRHEEVFVRRISALERIVASDPFAGSPYPDTVERTVSFLPSDIDLSVVSLPVESTSGRVSVFGATKTELFSAGRSVGGRTQGAGGLVERMLGCRITSRAWSTVLRIVDRPS
ncbi:MAG: DUF1697 domain-containing protein [Acidimicrobiia bacterium]